MNKHIMRGPCRLPSAPPSGGWGCTCGAGFADYYALAEHIRMTIDCPHCGKAPTPTLHEGDLYRWTCGHWMARAGNPATLKGTP